MSTARPLFQPEPPREPTPPRAPTPISAPRHRWRRFFLWAGGIILLLIAIVVVTVAGLLHSQKFHDYILAKVHSIATESLGAGVDVQNFALHFNPLGLDVYGVTVHGANPYPNPPVLQLQH